VVGHTLAPAGISVRVTVGSVAALLPGFGGGSAEELLAPAVRLGGGPEVLGLVAWEGVSGGWGMFSRSPGGLWNVSRFWDALEVTGPGVYAAAASLPAGAQLACPGAPPDRGAWMEAALMEAQDWAAASKQDLGARCLDRNSDGLLDVQDLLQSGRRARLMRGRHLSEERALLRVGAPLGHAACLEEGGVAAREVCHFEGMPQTVPLGARSLRVALPLGTQGMAAELRFGGGVVAGHGMRAGHRASTVIMMWSKPQADQSAWVVFNDTGAVELLPQSSVVTEQGPFPLVYVDKL
jgi:hypothetical protein